MMNGRLVGWLLFFVLLFTALGASAETYRWIDEKGVMHFSDRPRREASPLVSPASPPPAPAAAVQLVSPLPVVEARATSQPARTAADQEKPSRAQAGQPEPRRGLYDLRERVKATVGSDVIVLESGKEVKYIGVEDPGGFLLENGDAEKLAAAHSYHAGLVKGKTVTVLLGVVPRDKKGRYLGHVFLGQEAFINAELLRTGNALTEPFPSDFEYQSLFVRLEAEAQKKRLGIWGD